MDSFSAGSCECGNESSDSMTGESFLDQLSHDQLLKDSVSWISMLLIVA
jgi:hypothetical protein